MDLSTYFDEFSEEIEWKCQCDSNNKNNPATKRKLIRTYNMDNNQYLVLAFKIFNARHQKRDIRVDNFNEDKMSIFGKIYFFKNAIIVGHDWCTVAAVSHEGESINSGHYTARVRRPNTSWVKFDDMSDGPVIENLPVGLCQRKTILSKRNQPITIRESKCLLFKLNLIFFMRF